MATDNPNFPAGPYAEGDLIFPPPRPASPETSNLHFNHTMLRVKDAKKSVKFYCDGLGFHVVYICNFGPFTVYVLAPRDITSMQHAITARGMLELIHIPADANTPYASGNDYSAPGVGFGHTGFMVPDVEAVAKRLEKFGGEIIKPHGEFALNGMPPAVVKGEAAKVADVFTGISPQIAFVKDPDGYWVELVPQQMKF